MTVIKKIIRMASGVTSCTIVDDDTGEEIYSGRITDIKFSDFAGYNPVLFSTVRNMLIMNVERSE